ncbi:copper resistance protein NlpE [Algoriphagus vanfongensis]|uniref:copper resistance protein NlpE n=1 Tax=Algoriphagus vanfongensis TaxID=426371 RepID=UPI00047B5869|nr:copper resistance protein NlpE [Algoriphagus vanfongensis]
MMHLRVSTFAFLSLLFFACAEKPAQTEEQTLDQFPETIEVPLSSGDNSMNSLDWAGTYLGTLPCADCEGIETKLVLNQDGSYHYTTHYFGLNDALEHEYLGKFTWDESGSVITLHGVDGIPGKYKVGENRIWHLDMDGNQITGALADQYILTKQD